jgi:ubiquinone/menaquinone biosynthesis C-methylase UbiE
MFRSAVLRTTAPIHARIRANRSRMAAEIMRPHRSMSMLDIGGSPGLLGEFDSLRSLFGSVVVVNLDPGCNTRPVAANVTVEVADGCALPYPDASFDWVFSNAVLEHVGDHRKQEMFAKEMQRVARIGYFLATPNRHFFLDPHTYLPFYHLLPPKLQRWVVPLSLGYMDEWEEMRLVSAAELRAMFPSARVKEVGPFGVNLVAYAPAFNAHEKGSPLLG